MESFFLRTQESVREVLLQKFGVRQYVGNKTLVVRRIQPSAGQYMNETAGANRRYLMNHSKIVDRLRDSGHEVEEVTLEKLTMAQQACRFWSASTIIAHHGAGLSNLYFCRPGCRVIELGAYRRRHYVRLAELLKLDYRSIATKPRGEGPCFAKALEVVAAARG
jgi:capsular polysaccharide biosynthesis protein